MTTKYLILDSQLRHLAEQGDLGAACLAIQNIIGQTDGGIASQVFSGFDWDNATIGNRMRKLREYIRTEISYQD
jgi:hypothetical protein